MKKNIIVLLFLGGMAMGAESLVELDSSVLTLAPLKLDGGSNVITSSNKALSFSVDNKTSLTAYTITFGFVVAPPSEAKDPWLRLSNNQHGFKTVDASTIVAVNADWLAPIEGSLFTINTTDTFALTFSNSNIYISNLSEGSYVKVTTDVPGGWTLTSDSSRIYTNNSANQIQLGQVADLTGLTEDQVLQVATTGTYTVPEPATATLSLLALVGLAVRRRRK